MALVPVRSAIKPAAIDPKHPPISNIIEAYADFVDEKLPKTKQS